MGSIFAGLLADAGNDVWAIDLWHDHVEAIRNRGLRIEGASGDRLVTGLSVSGNAEDTRGAELYIIATKASGVGSAARAIASLCVVSHRRRRA